MANNTSTIRYYRETVYGNELFYPLDHIEAIAMLTTRKTLTRADFKALKNLGFELKEVLKPEER